MITRVLLLLIVAAPSLVSAHANKRHRLYSRADIKLLSRASVREPRLGLEKTVSWLRRHHIVLDAGIGPDHQTIEIEFRDGMKSTIMPSFTRKVRFRPPPLVPQVRAHATGDGSSRRALILEPFATEQMGPFDADAELAALRTYGYQIDQLSDKQVTVASMASIWQYNVVYFHTHAGINKWGYVDIATGQDYNGDPSLDAMIKNGTIMTTGIDGSNRTLYAILVSYIQNYWNQFPANSLLYIDTCSLLASQPLFQAIFSKGLGVFVSWDDQSTIYDQYRAATAFFRSLGAGSTVTGALNAVKAAKLNTSHVPGFPEAHFGYVGDGYITLSGRQAPPPTPTPIPSTATPTATSTPTPSPSPSPTASPTATASAPALSVDLTPTVEARSTQTVSVKSSPNTPVQIAVEYPNGNRQSTTLQTDSKGAAQYSYLQLASQIRHDSRTASVVVTAGNGTRTSTITRSYLIGFGNIDVSVEPRTTKMGQIVDFWIHTARHARVAIRLLESRRTLDVLHARTGPHGWAHRTYAISAGGLLSSGRTIRVRAQTQVGSRTVRSSSTFQIQ